MLSFFPRGVLDEILNLIGSVSEGFPSDSSMQGHRGEQRDVIYVSVFSSIHNYVNSGAFKTAPSTAV